MAGTAHALRTSPYPILEAYGEDPQLFLPPLANLPAGEELEIEIELREWSFAQALTFFGRGELQPASHGFAGIKRFLARLRGRAGRLLSRLAGGWRRQA